jgi:autotransporter-associated beta strand protein
MDFLPANRTCLRCLFSALLLWSINTATGFAETNYFVSSGAPGQTSWATASFWSLHQKPTAMDDVVLDNDYANGGSPRSFFCWRLHGNHEINSLTFSLNEMQTDNPARLFANALTGGTSKDYSLTLVSGSLTRTNSAFEGDIVVGATNEQNTGKILLSTPAAKYTITNNKAGSNLIIDAIVQGDGTNVEIAGDGRVEFGEKNTYTGNTTVSAESTFYLAEGSSLAFAIGADGVNNQLDGSGLAILEGAFVFELGNAGKRDGSKWQVIDVAKLNTNFGATFKVEGFTNVDGIWVNEEFQFNPATGVLMVRSRVGDP